MKDLKAVKGTYYINRLIAEGEHEHQDFKFAISDARKIARSISAFANNGGGRLLIGVKDNGAIAGVRNEEDIYVVEQAAQMYCRPEQHIEVTAFRVEGGAVVFRVDIARSEVRPVEVKEEQGRWKAYFRVADENIAAPEFMTRSWRRRCGDTPLVMSISGAESLLLEALEANGPMTPEELSRHGRLTREATLELIARLHALDLIDFTYSASGFRIVAAEAPDEP